MTDLQIRSLEATLAQRKRKLVETYQSRSGLHYAVSRPCGRPCGRRDAKMYQLHLLAVGIKAVTILETSGAPDL